MWFSGYKLLIVFWKAGDQGGVPFWDLELAGEGHEKTVVGGLGFQGFGFRVRFGVLGGSVGWSRTLNPKPQTLNPKP